MYRPIHEAITGGNSHFASLARVVTGQKIHVFRPKERGGSIFDPPCGDTWVCQVVIALWEITQATACTAKKRSRLITNRNVRS